MEETEMVAMEVAVGVEAMVEHLLGLHEHAHILDHHVPSNAALLQPVSKLLKQLRRCPDIHRSARHCLFPEVIDANVAELMQGGRLGLALHLCTQHLVTIVAQSSIGSQSSAQDQRVRQS